jgi:chemotaxis receptor (MCP) glutamine deamidase CheD
MDFKITSGSSNLLKHNQKLKVRKANMDFKNKKYTTESLNLLKQHFKNTKSTIRSLNLLRQHFKNKKNTTRLSRT